MAESTLTISFDELKEKVGHYLGYGPPGSWGDREESEVESYVQTGLRRFYYPPAVEGVETGYSWSFMTPQTTVSTVADTTTVDLPDDCGSIQGGLYYPEDEYNDMVNVVSRHQIRKLRSENDQSGLPQFAAIREKTSDGSDGQRKELVFWPTPDAVYVLTYQYEAFPSKLSQSNPYALGGMKHSELLEASCISVAEERANDARGVQWDVFIRLLATAIEQDRRNGAETFGQMKGPEPSDVLTARAYRDLKSGKITYQDSTW